MKILLIVLSLLLGGTVYLQWQDWPPELSLPDAEATSDAVGNLLDDGAVRDLSLPSISNYQVVVERPLFISGRRPLEPEAISTAAPPVPKHSDLTIQLIGVVITAKGQQVLVKDKKTQETSYLQIGDRIDGWIIQQIDPERLTLQHSGRVEELPLRVYPEEVMPKVRPKQRPVRQKRVTKKAPSAPRDRRSTQRKR